MLLAGENGRQARLITPSKIVKCEGKIELSREILGWGNGTVGKRGLEGEADNKLGQGV